MKIPLKYNLRSLGRRKMRTALTLGGIAFVTVVVVLMSSLIHSMWNGIKNNGSPDNVILLSKKGQNAIFSSIKEVEMAQLTNLRNVKSDEETGFLYLSPEILTGIGLRVEGYPLNKGCVLRGVDPIDDIAYLVNDTVRIHTLRVEVEGAKVSLDTDRRGKVTLGVEAEGHQETVEADSLAALRANRPDLYRTYVMGKAPDTDGVLVGRLAHIKMGVNPDDLAPGKKLGFGEMEFTIQGSFEAPGTSFESELWANVEDLKVILNRRTYSQITIKVDKAENLPAVIDEVRGREDVKLNIQPEQKFYAAYSENFNLFRSLILVIAVIVGFGGVFAGMNTMYAAVMGRIREIGTLKVLGFPSASIFFSILSESLFIAFGGGILGAGAAFGISLLLSEAGGLGIPIKISMNAFLVTVNPPDVIIGLVSASVIGILGAILPALKGVRMKIVDALRWA